MLRPMFKNGLGVDASAAGVGVVVLGGTELVALAVGGCDAAGGMGWALGCCWVGLVATGGTGAAGAFGACC